MKIIKSFIVLSALVFPMIASAEVWNVTEGIHSEWKGTWTKQSGTRPGPIIFNANMQDGGTIVTYTAIVYINGNYVTVQRVNSSDGSKCNYNGTFNGANNINGTTICAGGNGSWNAILSPGLQVNK